MKEVPVVTAGEEMPVEVTENVTGGAIRMYPNPTGDRFTLKLPGGLNGETATVEICNLLGETVLKDEFCTGRMRNYSLGTRQPGIYLVRVTRNGVTGTGKVIRQ